LLSSLGLAYAQTPPSMEQIAIQSCRQRSGGVTAQCVREHNQVLQRQAGQALRDSLVNLPPEFRDRLEDIIQVRAFQGGFDGADVQRTYRQLALRGARHISGAQTEWQASDSAAAELIRRWSAAPCTPAQAEESYLGACSQQATARSALLACGVTDARSAAGQGACLRRILPLLQTQLEESQRTFGVMLQIKARQATLSQACFEAISDSRLRSQVCVAGIDTRLQVPGDIPYRELRDPGGSAGGGRRASPVSARAERRRSGRAEDSSEGAGPGQPTVPVGSAGAAAQIPTDSPGAGSAAAGSSRAESDAQVGQARRDAQGRTGDGTSTSSIYSVSGGSPLRNCPFVTRSGQRGPCTPQPFNPAEGNNMEEILSVQRAALLDEFAAMIVRSTAEAYANRAFLANPDIDPNVLQNRLLEACASTRSGGETVQGNSLVNLLMGDVEEEGAANPLMHGAIRGAMSDFVRGLGARSVNDRAGLAAARRRARSLRSSEIAILARDARRAAMLTRELEQLQRDFAQPISTFADEWPGFLPGGTFAHVVQSMTNAWESADSRATCSSYGAGFLGARLGPRGVDEGGLTSADQELVDLGLITRERTHSRAERCEMKSALVRSYTDQLHELLSRQPLLAEIDRGGQRGATRGATERAMYLNAGSGTLEFAQEYIRGYIGDARQSGQADEELLDALRQTCRNRRPVALAYLADDRTLESLLSCGGNAPVPVDLDQPNPETTPPIRESCRSLRERFAAVGCMVRQEASDRSLIDAQVVQILSSSLDMVGTAGILTAAPGAVASSLRASVTESLDTLARAGARRASQAALGGLSGALVSIPFFNAAERDYLRTVQCVQAGLGCTPEDLTRAAQAYEEARRAITTYALLGGLIDAGIDAPRQLPESGLLDGVRSPDGGTLVLSRDGSGRLAYGHSSAGTPPRSAEGSVTVTGGGSSSGRGILPPPPDVPVEVDIPRPGRLPVEPTPEEAVNSYPTRVETPEERAARRRAAGEFEGNDRQTAAPGRRRPRASPEAAGGEAPASSAGSDEAAVEAPPVAQSEAEPEVRAPRSERPTRPPGSGRPTRPARAVPREADGPPEAGSSGRPTRRPGSGDSR
jgi:hypothetical protein